MLPTVVYIGAIVLRYRACRSSEAHHVSPIFTPQKNEDRRLRAGHVWVFSNEIDTKVTPLSGFEPGQPVVIEDAAGHALGTGYVNPQRFPRRLVQSFGFGGGLRMPNQRNVGSGRGALAGGARNAFLPDAKSRPPVAVTSPWR